MKKNIILIIISLFVCSSVNAQNKKGIIYEYKKTQFTSSIGTKGFVQVGYIKRLTKNIGIGGSISRNKYTDTYDERSSIAFMADFKWNLRVKKRVQPVYMFSVGFATGIGPITRTYFGLDLHSKNDKYVLTPFYSTLDYDLVTMGIKFTIKK
jgi:hypothetical protein